MNADTDFFPALLQQEATAKAAEEVANRAYHLKEIVQHWRNCWPEWEGPKVEDSVHGRCSVGTCVVFNMTHGQKRYHYMAPCVIESIDDDGLTVYARIDYRIDSATETHCAYMNGQLLKLDLTEVWPPVSHLAEARRLAEHHVLVVDEVIDCPEKQA